MVALAKAKDFERQAMAWMRPEPEAPRPKVHEVIRLVVRAEKDYRIPAIQDIHKTALIAQDLETRCDQVLKNRFHGDEDMFETISQWKNYTQTHLRIFTLPSFEKLDALPSLPMGEGIALRTIFCPTTSSSLASATLPSVLPLLVSSPTPSNATIATLAFTAQTMGVPVPSAIITTGMLDWRSLIMISSSPSVFSTPSHKARFPVYD
ncbi:hypothetical protein K438DRAFT_1984248 [Mycena galopus ATCC 62051]|nr:hypothetical protein K438DRAFT_1984248 [Mycena galopus ATCC 62051]